IPRDTAAGVDLHDHAGLDVERGGGVDRDRVLHPEDGAHHRTGRAPARVGGDVGGDLDDLGRSGGSREEATQNEGGKGDGAAHWGPRAAERSGTAGGGTVFMIPEARGLQTVVLWGRA